MESKTRRLVMEREFTLASGRKAVCRIYDDENTVPKSNVEEHQKCVDRMKEVAANIFMRAALGKQQKESAQGGGNRD